MRITVAKAIVKVLEDAGTEVCFGYNGHGNWALLDAFVHESSIRTIATRSEDQAVHMADLYWRMKRKPPMAVVTTSVGPGNANITPAIASAFFESSALLVLAGGGATQWLDRGGIEEYYRYGPDEWTDSLRTITKKSFCASRPDTALEMLLRAYKTAITGRPGPVVIQLPFDIQNTEIELRSIPETRQWVRVSRPGPDGAAIRAAADLIERAERPLVTVSSGIQNANAQETLRSFLEEFQLPLTTAVPGKNVVPEDHPLNLGCVGRAGTGQANQASRECDLLIGIGTRFGDIDTGGWSLYDIPGGTKLIHIDIDSEEIARVYPTEVGLVADAGLALEALQAELRSRARIERPGWLARVGELRTEWLAEVRPLEVDDSAPMGYARVFTAVSEALIKHAPDASVLFDTGHSLSFGPAFLRAPGCTYVHSNFFHRMGWSIPGLIGAKVARPDAPALTIVGDGSFIMAGTAIATAVELGLDMTFVVLNNKTLQVERELMIRFYGRHALTDYTRLDTGEPFNPDFVAWAAAMGANGRKVSQPADLEPALREALTGRGVNVIDVDIDPESPGYRSIHYRYPSDFAERGIPNPPF